MMRRGFFWDLDVWADEAPYVTCACIGMPLCAALRRHALMASPFACPVTVPNLYAPPLGVPPPTNGPQQR